MFHRLRLQCTCFFFVICLCFWLTNGEGEPEPQDICKSCLCDSTIFLISCENMKYTELFSEAEWNATLEGTYKNITGNDTLDVRFDQNLLTHVTKFPHLNISLLSLAGNNISTIADAAFAELEILDWLDLSYNSLSTNSLTENAFFGKYNESNYFPISVQHLNLSHNLIHVIGKDFFDHMPALVTLDVSHNPLVILDGSTAAAISSLQYLKALILQHTSIKDMPAGMLHSLMQLIVLDISGNEFKKVPSEIGYAHNLTMLTVSSNKFEELDNTSFLGLEHLEELCINNMPSLKFIGAETFGPLKKLHKIEIIHNRNLREISDAAFFGMVNQSSDWPVKDIYLHSNGLSHIDQQLAAWEQVDHVDIHDNPFRCDCRLEWMTEVLVDNIRRENPMAATNMVCSEPEEMRGRSLVALSIEHGEFAKCHDGGTISGSGNSEFNKDSYQTAGVTILVIGIMLIIIGLSILGVIVVKRRAIALALMNHQQIRYERTGTDDIEYTNRYNGYSDPK